MESDKKNHWTYFISHHVTAVNFEYSMISEKTIATGAWIFDYCSYEVFLVSETEVSIAVLMKCYGPFKGPR